MSNYGDDWRDTDFGEGQERYYGNLGGASQGPTGGEPPQGGGPTPPAQHGDGGGGGGAGKTALIAGGAVAVVAIAAGGVYLANRGGDDSSSGAPDTSAAAPPSASTQADPSPSASAQETSTHKPAVSGWQVASGDDNYPVIFDVPPASKKFTAANGSSRSEWEISTDAGAEYGFFDPRLSARPLATTRYAATYRLGNCSTAEGNALAFLGFFKSSSDAPDAARFTSDKFAKAMSLKENGKDRVKYTEGKPKTVKVNGGKTSAVQIRTDIPWSRSDPSFCVKGERELVVTSVATPQGTGTVVASRVKSGQGVLDEKAFEKILGTIRPRS